MRITHQCSQLQIAFAGQQCDHQPSPLRGYNPESVLITIKGSNEKTLTLFGEKETNFWLYLSPYWSNGI